MAKRSLNKPKLRPSQMGWREISAEEIKRMVDNAVQAAHSVVHPDYRDGEAVALHMPPTKSIPDEFPLAGTIHYTAQRLSDLRRKIDDFVQDVAGSRPTPEKATLVSSVNSERPSPSTVIDVLLFANGSLGSDINRIEEAIDFLRSRL